MALKQSVFIIFIFSKTFTQLAHLKIHKMGVHSDIRPYACDICGKVIPSFGFTFKYYLKYYYLYIGLYL